MWESCLPFLCLQYLAVCVFLSFYVDLSYILLLLGTVVYDAILDFGVSVLFLIVSSIALAAALYYDCQRIVSFIVGLSFVAVPLVQIILKFFVWEDAEEDALDGMLFLWSFVA
jgi:hypothetical protein